MNYLHIISAIIFIPVIGSFFLPLAGTASKTLRNWLSLLLVALSLGFTMLLLPFVSKGSSIFYSFVMPLGFNFTIQADPLAVFMALTSLVIGLIIVFYSFDYISHYDNQNEYYLMVVLFLGSMMGIVFSGSLLGIYIFWELTALASWRLIGFFRKDADVIKADKAFLVTFFGAVVMLLGFIMIYNRTGSFDLYECQKYFKGHEMPGVIVLLILAGIFSKSATLPLQTWLPDAGVAPSPVTALLHAAVLVKIGVYVYARLFAATFDIGAVWHTVVPAVAALSALVSGCAALVDKDLKRIIAYSTISQIGFIFFGLSVGNSAGLCGGLLYILMHGLAKAGLFLCAGIVEQNTHQKDITKLGGLIKTMPLTAMAFLFCSFSVMGIPPFGGFFSKYLVFAGGMMSREFFITFVFLAGAFLTVIYLFRVFSMVFLGELRIEAKEGSPAMVYSVVSLAALSLAAGIFIKYSSDFAQAAVSQILLVMR